MSENDSSSYGEEMTTLAESVMNPVTKPAIFPVTMEGTLEKISLDGDFTLSVLSLGGERELIKCESLSETQKEYRDLPLRSLFGKDVVCKGFIISDGFACGEMSRKFMKRQGWEEENEKKRPAELSIEAKENIEKLNHDRWLASQSLEAMTLDKSETERLHRLCIPKVERRDEQISKHKDAITQLESDLKKLDTIIIGKDIRKNAYYHDMMELRGQVAGQKTVIVQLESDLRAQLEGGEK